jgi:hypothetical protein
MYSSGNEYVERGGCLHIMDATDCMQPHPDFLAFRQVPKSLGGYEQLHDCMHARIPPS